MPAAGNRGRRERNDGGGDSRSGFFANSIGPQVCCCVSIRPRPAGFNLAGPGSGTPDVRRAEGCPRVALRPVNQIVAWNAVFGDVIDKLPVLRLSFSSRKKGGDTASEVRIAPTTVPPGTPPAALQQKRRPRGWHRNRRLWMPPLRF